MEGWRFLPHSYAIVNQWQLLALSRRDDVAIKVVDAPLYHPRWRTEPGLFEPDREEALKSIPVAQANESADATLRIFARFDFSPSRSIRTAVFATLEAQWIRRNYLCNPALYDQFRKGVAPREISVVTPSHWSAEGFYKAGFSVEQVHIIPHGVDTDMFHPMPELGANVRADMGIPDGDFAFMSIGAMTRNKGIDLLLEAFSEVHRKFPHARLILKGVDPLYRSNDLLRDAMSGIAIEDQQRITERISYFGQSFSFHEMAMFYQAADAYVSPYRAEGFNMPVLEAAACGLPVICTGGGATDDFVNEDFARAINSNKVMLTSGDDELSVLNPDVDHLIALMNSAIEDDAWRRRASAAGPVHVRGNYTWGRAVDMLVGKLLN